MSQLHCLNCPIGLSRDKPHEDNPVAKMGIRWNRLNWTVLWDPTGYSSWDEIKETQFN